jgi:AcrR family transcriptional regulator
MAPAGAILAIAVRFGGMRRPKLTGSDRGISTEDWIRIARMTLIKEGIAGVKVDRLARKAGVTRGGFYYRFKDHQALLDALLQDWRETNNKPILDVLYGPGTPAERFLGLARLWLDERDFDPDYDTAVRAWSQVSQKVAAAVHEIDDSRIQALRKLFIEAGYEEDEAFVRARISYFHQVGYYAMGIRESAKRRAELSELYLRVLTGFRNGELREISDLPQRTKAAATPELAWLDPTG